MSTHKWWTIVQHGSYGNTAPTPRGPWHTEDDARAALQRWRERQGSEAGSAEAATSVRIYGPYRTRAAALDADISQRP